MEGVKAETGKLLEELTTEDNFIVPLQKEIALIRQVEKIKNDK